MQKHFLKASGCGVRSPVRSAVRENPARRFERREKSGVEAHRETFQEAGIEREADAGSRKRLQGLELESVWKVIASGR